MTFSLRRSRPLASTAIKLLTLAAASLSPVSNALYCDGPPSAGCTNGLWNEAECHCDCIPPFCRDVYGACSLGVCGASAVAAWADCEAGLNCPWWVNPLKTERCTTGPEVPPGIWDIYQTRADCCNMKYPYSKVCNDGSKSSDFSDSALATTRQPTNAPTRSPTPYPTISAPEDPTTEVVPLGFQIVSLPLEVDMNAFRDKMRNVIKKVVLTLAEKYSTLKILNVELRSSGRRLSAAVNDGTIGNNALLRGNKGSDNNAIDERGGRNKWKIPEKEAAEGGSMTRALQREPFEMIYDVIVLRQDGVQWAPLIRQAVEDDRDYIMDQILEFAGIRDYGDGIKSDLNFCMQSFTAQGFVDCDPSLYVPITQLRPPSTESSSTQPPSKPSVSTPVGVYRPTVGTEIVIGAKDDPTFPPSYRPTRSPVTLPPFVPASESKNQFGPGVFTLDTEVQVEGFTMDWWVIVLIALGVMVLLICVFLILFSICCGRKRMKEEQVINNTIHMDKLKTRSSAGSRSSGSDSDESDRNPPRPYKRPQQRNNMPPQQFMHYPLQYPYPPDRLLPVAQIPPQQRMLAIDQQPFSALPPRHPIQNGPIAIEMNQHQRVPFNQTRRPQNDPPAPVIANQPQIHKRDTQHYFDHDEDSLPDLSIGEIDSQFYGDFENMAKPDPSMYSLFADYKNERRGKKANSTNKRKPREPTAITAKELLRQQKQQQQKEPILYLENGSMEDAPGLRASQIILAAPVDDDTNNDDGLTPRGEMGLIGNGSNLEDLDEEDTNYTEKEDGEFDADANNEPYFVISSRGRDKSYHIDDLPPRDDMFFPDANEVMSMISDDFPPDGFGYSERSEELSTFAKKKKSKSKKKSRKSEKRRIRRIVEVDSELS